KRIAVTAGVLALVGACQAHNAQEVDPQTSVALATEGTYVRAQPPTLLSLPDRAASMRYCLEPAPTPGSGHGCSPLGGAPEYVVPERRSRMVVARSVIEKTARQHP